MSEQLYFDLSHARRSDPVTSREAAASARDLADAHCLAIRDALRRHGPQQYEEIAKRIGRGVA